VPSAGNVKDFNRYAYGRYNPLAYVDPSGYAACRTKEDCENAGMSPAGKDLITLTPVVYANIVYKEFGWKVDKNFSMPEMQNIFVTGWQIKTFVDSFTDGKGQDWMQNNLSGIHMHKGGLPFALMTIKNGAPTSVVFPRNHIWFSDISKLHLRQHIAHEIAHPYDNRSNKSILPATIFGGGLSDALCVAAGGNPKGIRATNGTAGIDPIFEWFDPTDGNRASAEYFAEAWSWAIYDPSNLPSSWIYYWVIGKIIEGLP
jgi:hypothetical protein